MEAAGDQAPAGGGLSPCLVLSMFGFPTLPEEPQDVEKAKPAAEAEDAEAEEEDDDDDDEPEDFMIFPEGIWTPLFLHTIYHK